MGALYCMLVSVCSGVSTLSQPPVRLSYVVYAGWILSWKGRRMTDDTQRCRTCILPAAYPGVTFDQSGECNYCQSWKEKWGNLDFAQQEARLDEILSKHRGRTKPYDCLIGLSGGKDSCYAALVLKKRGMNPLACTFDNGFLTDRARHNIDSTVRSLSIGHVVLGYSKDYLNTLYKSTVTHTGEFCSVCNVGIRSTLYRLARSYGIDLIVSGQSNRTEASSPREFFTCSAGYFRNVLRASFSTREFDRFDYYSRARRIVGQLTNSPFLLQLPSYLPWKEELFLKEIASELDWKGSFGEQHTDCRMSDAKEYLKLKKFGVTELTAKLSSLVRDGQITRDEALARMEEHRRYLLQNETTICETLRNEFSLSADELEMALTASHIAYLSETDSLLGSLKSVYERVRR